MSYEVDILAVGDETKCGDAILVRFGDFVNEPASQKVIVIDGGYRDTGKKLIEHIKSVYQTDTVDLVISTHPDSDHINGLFEVLENLTVKELWIHTPWNLSEDVKKIAVENRITEYLGNANQLRKSLEAAYDLEQMAIKKGITIKEPFEGLVAFNGIITVMGPSLDYYADLVSEEGDAASHAGISLTSVIGKLRALITERWHADELAEPRENAVSSRNNSSTIVYVKLEDGFLFVGDAGVPALSRAADYADGIGLPFTAVGIQQVPHHGSKRNLGPTVLNRIVGPILDQGSRSGKRAFVSAASKSEKHPSKRVSNAYIRRGVRLVGTMGNSLCYHSTDVPVRSGWSSAIPLDFVTSYHEE